MVCGVQYGRVGGSVGQCAGDSGAESASAAHIVIEYGDFGLQGVPLRHISRAIGAGIVDDDDAIRLPGLRGQRVEALLQQTRAVVGHDDGGDGKTHAFQYKRQWLSAARQVALDRFMRLVSGSARIRPVVQ
jgi:hypothetical protein